MTTLTYSRFWLLTLFIKFLLISIIPFANDEAYYWVWGQNPQLSYYDHPPLIGWLFTLGSFGFKNSLLSKWPVVLLGHLSFLLWNEILKSKMSLSQQKNLLILFCLAPLSGLGSIVATPDVPLLFTWTLTLFLFLKTLSSFSSKYFAYLGLSLGVCFLAKYHAVLFIPPALFLLWNNKPSIKAFVLGFSTTLFFCLLASSPVLIWNYHNDWLSFKFQLGHGFSSRKWSPLWPVLYVVGQFFLIFPSLGWSCWKARNSEPLFKILLPFLVFPLAFFGFSSFFARVEPNWTSMSLPIAIAIGFIGFQYFKSQLWKHLTFLFLALLNLLVFAELLFGFIPYPLKTDELKIYQTLSKSIFQYEPLFARTYQMASQLSFISGKPTYKLNGFNRLDFFDYQKESLPRTSPYFVAVESGENLPQSYLDQGHQIVERINIDSRFDIIKVVFEQ